MSIPISSIVKPMVAAAKTVLADDWPKIKKFAEPELKRLGQSLKDIAQSAAKEDISRAEAKSLLRIHRNTTLTVLLTVEGLGVITAERAINRALGAAADVVNAALPFKLV